MRKIIKYLWVIPALIFASTLPYKFTGNGLPYLDTFFDGLTNGLGEYVMAAIGLQELVIVAGLVTNEFRKHAAFGSIVTMVGAISTHFYLGQFDIVFIEAWIVLLTSIFVLYREFDMDLNFVLDKNEIEL